MVMPAPLDERTERIATEIVDAAWRVFREFGPGLLESVYEAALARALEKRGLHVRRQVPVPVFFEGEQLQEVGFRIDLLVEDCVVVECKTSEKLIPLYKAQLLTYLKLTGKRLGFLINFNIAVFREGIERVIL